MSENTKLFYSIGEVAKMFDVNASLIRFWESEFNHLKPRKNSKGNRIYTKDDIEILTRIYTLVKERGYTLQGAKDIISKKQNDKLSNEEIIVKLNSIKKFLLELKNTL